METNVTISNQIPAGMVTGMEAFWYNNQKMLFLNGESKPLDHFPAKIQNIVVDAFRDDMQSRDYLKKMNVTSFSDQFEKWYQCVIGGLDNVSDFDSKGLHPDAYNNTCTQTNCPHRGKLCGRQSGISSIDVSRIKLIASGETIEKAAKKSFLSIAGMKSWLEKTKEKFNVPNTPSMIATSVRLGIY